MKLDVKAIALTGGAVTAAIFAWLYNRIATTAAKTPLPRIQ